MSYNAYILTPWCRKNRGSFGLMAGSIRSLVRMRDEFQDRHIYRVYLPSNHEMDTRMKSLKWVS